MKTVVEADKNGEPVTVFHRAGNITEDGVVRKDEKYAWSHPYAERDKCEACQKLTIPAWVKRGERG